MVHLLDKLTGAQLGFLLAVVVIAVCVTICSVFNSLRRMVTGRYQRAPITGGGPADEPLPADGEGQERSRITQASTHPPETED